MTPPLSVAPMMERTDRHFRVLLRQVTRRCLLYTEMVVAQAILRGDARRHLEFSDIEHPISLQLGGDDPAMLAECARAAEGFGYDEVDLNVGCPSDRVQSGHFGVCLMATPELVADCVRAMKEACSMPVTVKHRIGFDEQDTYEQMLRFVDTVAEAGCDRFTVHARKAWLQGLSPRENREVPPLRYEDVYRLKRERPQLAVELNGGVTTLDAVEAHLEMVDAVMLGRAAYDDPMLLSTADSRFFGGDDPGLCRVQIVEAMAAYASERIDAGDRLGHVARHLLNLFHGRPGARKFRRHLSRHAHRPGAGASVLLDALELIPATASG
ncbi:MAG TPA: tRNA dihydrouridine(20/20a) synthase DusA [Myxococcota bacterium]|nr:tRNA dihydrouridine(20/20a) synthase DusA [Myxococcota bacterium]